MRVGVTGHRPPRLCGGYDYWHESKEAWGCLSFLRSSLSTALTMSSKLVCATGMAQGADQLFAEVCVEMGLPFEAFVPYQGFGSLWPKSAQAEYRDLLEKSAAVHYTSPQWYRGVEVDRDRELVRWLKQGSPALLLAVWDGEENGGTYATVRRATKERVDVWKWNPREAG